MKRLRFLPVLVLVTFFTVFVQAQRTLEFNKDHTDISLKRSDTLIYKLPLLKDGIYQFAILQRGIAVYYELVSPAGEKVFENLDIYDIKGYEKFEHTATTSGTYSLIISRFEHDANPDTGKINISVKSLSKKEIAVRKQIRRDLASENAKNVTTVDIDHFWTAFDSLKSCKTYADSVSVLQKNYLDRATDGMLDFIQVRDWTAERFVDAISKHRDFYQQVRQNTLDAKTAVPIIEDVFARFKEIYTDFKPFKVCFAIGIKNTGGTVSDKYVLIGTEVTVAGAVSAQDIVQKIRGIVAHECVHTQQKLYPDSAAIHCPLLWQSIREGSCDFIGELITGQSRTNEYGEKNEGKLWADFKNELCNKNFDNWLYNGYAGKDRPGDLGYFIGYQIAKEYYRNTPDKKQAVREIINMTDPIHFLEQSKYDQKPKN
jgi:hypothetical protein